MNIGFYVDSLAESEQTIKAYETLNKWVESGETSDASLFYNDIGFNSIIPKFGLFNSTDVWQFTGNLIITSFSAASAIEKVINKFKSVFWYCGQPEKNIMQIIHILNNVPIIVSTKEDFDYIKRITGKTPSLIEDMSLEKLKGVF